MSYAVGHRLREVRIGGGVGDDRANAVHDLVDRLVARRHLVDLVLEHLSLDQLLLRRGSLRIGCVDSWRSLGARIKPGCNRYLRRYDNYPSCALWRAGPGYDYRRRRRRHVYRRTLRDRNSGHRVGLLQLTLLLRKLPLLLLTLAHLGRLLLLLLLLTLTLLCRLLLLLLLTLTLLLLRLLLLFLAFALFLLRLLLALALFLLFLLRLLLALALLLLFLLLTLTLFLLLLLAFTLLFCLLLALALRLKLLGGLREGLCAR